MQISYWIFRDLIENEWYLFETVLLTIHTACHGIQLFDRWKKTNLMFGGALLPPAKFDCWNCRGIWLFNTEVLFWGNKWDCCWTFDCCCCCCCCCIISICFWLLYEPSCELLFVSWRCCCCCCCCCCCWCCWRSNCFCCCCCCCCCKCFCLKRLSLAESLGLSVAFTTAFPPSTGVGVTVVTTGGVDFPEINKDATKIKGRNEQ